VLLEDEAAAVVRPEVVVEALLEVEEEVLLEAEVAALLEEDEVVLEVLKEVRNITSSRPEDSSSGFSCARIQAKLLTFSWTMCSQAQVQKSSLSHTDMQASSSQKARNIFSLQRTSYQENQCTARSA
jgi:hypothetical protein